MIYELGYKSTSPSLVLFPFTIPLRQDVFPDPVGAIIESIFSF